jgi:putative zinc finger/helix-turn-helix YgiT family protein
MKCLKCNSEKFKREKARFHPELKGEVLDVTVPAFICEKCQTPLMDSKQMNILRKGAADEYRKKHGLLTSSDIIAYRNDLGLSQKAFAEYLHVGEASIKRWETCFVQDASQDELIRLKCDQSKAEVNFKNLTASLLKT